MFGFSDYSSLSYADGVQLPSNSLIYGHLPIGGTFYISNYTCPDNSISLDNCSEPQAALTPQCYNGELDLVLQCTGGMLWRVIYTIIYICVCVCVCVCVLKSVSQ